MADGQQQQTAEPIDLVIPLGTGSRHGDAELRYLLRSALANLRGLRLVHIIGPHRPAWLRRHERIRWHQWQPKRVKNHDIIAKFLHAATLPEVSERFIASCDDWYFLAPVVPCVDWGACVNGGVLSNAIREGYWKRCQASTRLCLERAHKPVRFYDTHTPSVQTKAGWLRVGREVRWQAQTDHAVWSLYHNVAGVHGPEVGAARHCGWHAGDGSAKPKSREQIEQATAGRWFLKANDSGLNRHLLDWLAARFPTPAPWEGEAMAPAAAAPAKAAPKARPANAAPAAKAPAPVKAPAAPAPVMPTATAALADTLLVLAYCREDAPRHAATVAAVGQLGRLDPLPAIRLLELGDEPSADLRDLVGRLPGAQYVFLQCGDEHVGLFHKEDLWNLATRQAGPQYRCLLYLDADTYPTSTDWAGRARAAILAGGDGIVWQPWDTFHDTLDKALSGTSAAALLDGSSPDRRASRNPGLAIGLTRGCWESIRGFPCTCPAGAGDTMLMCEITGGRWAPPWAPQRPYFLALRRTLPTKRVRAIREAMVHQHHGTKQDRGYALRHELLGRCYPWGAGLRLDARGLLSVEPGTPLQWALRLRKLCRDEHDVDLLVDNARRLCGPPHCCSPERYLQAKARRPEYWDGRWGYYQAATNLLQALPRAHGGRVLEIGPWDCPLVDRATYLDIRDHGIGAIVHDAGVAPWPVAAGTFDAVVALQVVEHLPSGRAFLAEAARVARKVLISVPWEWPRGEAGHVGISWPTLREWAADCPPEASHRMGRPPHERMLLVWDSVALLQAFAPVPSGHGMA